MTEEEVDDLAKRLSKELTTCIKSQCDGEELALLRINSEFMINHSIVKWLAVKAGDEKELNDFIDKLIPALPGNCEVTHEGAVLCVLASNK